jgi:hypothetical protein
MERERAQEAALNTSDENTPVTGKRNADETTAGKRIAAKLQRLAAGYEWPVKNSSWAGSSASAQSSAKTPGAKATETNPGDPKALLAMSGCVTLNLQKKLMANQPSEKPLVARSVADGKPAHSKEVRQRARELFEKKGKRFVDVSLRQASLLPL